ncbi:33069_t:CDS:1, partial [Gigaspora margarita]
IDPAAYITSLQSLTPKITISNNDILNYLKDHAKDSIILRVAPFTSDSSQDSSHS